MPDSSSNFHKPPSPPPIPGIPAMPADLQKNIYMPQPGTGAGTIMMHPDSGWIVYSGEQVTPHTLMNFAGQSRLGLTQGSGYEDCNRRERGIFQSRPTPYGGYNRNRALPYPSTPGYRGGTFPWVTPYRKNRYGETDSGPGIIDLTSNEEEARDPARDLNEDSLKQPISRCRLCIESNELLDSNPARMSHARKHANILERNINDVFYECFNAPLPPMNNEYHPPMLVAPSPSSAETFQAPRDTHNNIPRGHQTPGNKTDSVPENQTSEPQTDIQASVGRKRGRPPKTPSAFSTNNGVPTQRQPTDERLKSEAGRNTVFANQPTPSSSEPEHQKDTVKTDQSTPLTTCKQKIIKMEPGSLSTEEESPQSAQQQPEVNSVPKNHGNNASEKPVERFRALLSEAVAQATKVGSMTCAIKDCKFTKELKEPNGEPLAAHKLKTATTAIRSHVQGHCGKDVYYCTEHKVGIKSLSHYKKHKEEGHNTTVSMKYDTWHVDYSWKFDSDLVETFIACFPIADPQRPKAPSGTTQAKESVAGSTNKPNQLWTDFLDSKINQVVDGYFIKCRATPGCNFSSNSTRRPPKGSKTTQYRQKVKSSLENHILNKHLPFPVFECRLCKEEFKGSKEMHQRLHKGTTGGRGNWFKDHRCDKSAELIEFFNTNFVLLQGKEKELASLLPDTSGRKSEGAPPSSGRPMRIIKKNYQ